MDMILLALEDAIVLTGPIGWSIVTALGIAFTALAGVIRHQFNANQLQHKTNADDIKDQAKTHAVELQTVRTGYQKALDEKDTMHKDELLKVNADLVLSNKRYATSQDRFTDAILADRT